MPGQKKTPTLLLLCLTAGTLDAIAAIVMSWPHTTGMFKYIASGWVGVEAFKGGTGMVVLGILSHYLIASIHSCVFFFLYPGFKRVIGNKFAIAIVMGILIWAIMEFIVLPLSNIPKRTSPESVSSMLIGAGVLCITLGAPIVVFADRYFSGKVR